MSSELVVGLTGGIGSGKSAVCREFEHLAVPIVDADIVARDVVEPGSIGLRAVIDSFGEAILNSGGTIDRGKLRLLIFEDDNQRKLLESILHPMIRQRIAEQLAAIRSPYCILCVPLLVEKHGYENMGRILVVDCSIELQISRVMQRDNLTRAQVNAIMQTQATREKRLRMADDVVENAGGIEELRTQVKALHSKYTAIADQLELAASRA